MLTYDRRNSIFNKILDKKSFKYEIRGDVVFLYDGDDVFLCLFENFKTIFVTGTISIVKKFKYRGHIIVTRYYPPNYDFLKKVILNV